MGFVPGRFPATSRLPVRRYLGHLAAIHGGGGRALRRARELLDRFGFSGDVEGPVAQLSTGNAQKVGLAQALCPAPGLAVLDEPWNGLDDPAGAVLDRCLADLSRSVPVLVADHTGHAQALPGARVHRLRDGLVRADRTVGAAQQVLSEVVVRCSRPSEDLLARLPEPTSVRQDGSTLHVLVEPSRCDAWLAAALAEGCSVLPVRRDGAEPPC